MFEELNIKEIGKHTHTHKRTTNTHTHTNTHTNTHTKNERDRERERERVGKETKRKKQIVKSVASDIQIAFAANRC